MKLGSPNVVGPISVANDTLRVRGQMPGATVIVYRNGVEWFQKSTSDYDVRLSMPGPLSAGDELAVAQTLGSDTSPRSAIPLVVQAVKELDHLVFASFLYRCAEGIYITAANPGAQVEFKIGTHASGKALAEFGDVQMMFGDRVGGGEVVEARQHATVGGTTLSGGWVKSPLPVDPPQPLPAPTIAQAEACQTALDFGKLVEGVRVTYDRDSGGTDVFVSLFQNRHRYGLAPLKLNEKVVARQEFGFCEMRSPESTPMIVGPTSKAPPTVKDGLCAGGRIVRISQAQEGAQIVVFQNGTEIANATAYATDCDVGVDPLTGGAQVTARLIRCGIPSDLSSAVTVNPTPGTIPPAKIPVNPLFECAGWVPVTNVHPGSWLVVYSKDKGLPISGHVYAAATDMLVPVAPALVQGDKVFVRQYACNNTVSDSDSVPVTELGQLSPPDVEEPIYAGTNLVFVRGVTAGAFVDVFVNDVRVATAMAAGDRVPVYLPMKLEMDRSVNARQRMCQQVTERGPRRVVRRPLPNPPFDLVPDLARTAGDSPRRPVLGWKDNSPSIAKPSSYEVQVATTASFPTPHVASATVPAPPWTVPIDLAYSTKYFWRVRGVNSSGPSPWSTASLHTIPEPPPPALFSLVLGVDTFINLKRINSVKWGFSGPGVSGQYLNGTINLAKTGATATYSPPSNPQGVWYFGLDVDMNYLDDHLNEWNVVVQTSVPLEYTWTLGPGGTRLVTFQVKLRTSEYSKFFDVAFA